LDVGLAGLGPPDGRRFDKVDNVSTLVFAKENGKWLIASGENVTVDPMAAAHEPATGVGWIRLLGVNAPHLHWVLMLACAPFRNRLVINDQIGLWEVPNKAFLKF
jgi:hypothetical protein